MAINQNEPSVSSSGSYTASNGNTDTFHWTGDNMDDLDEWMEALGYDQMHGPGMWVEDGDVLVIEDFDGQMRLQPDGHLIHKNDEFAVSQP
jgi:hypothetical protein